MHSDRQQLKAELIATLGSEPQVVTATLDLLLDQEEPGRHFALCTIG